MLKNGIGSLFYQYLLNRKEFLYEVFLFKSIWKVNIQGFKMDITISQFGFKMNKLWMFEVGVVVLLKIKVVGEAAYGTSKLCIYALGLHT